VNRKLRRRHVVDGIDALVIDEYLVLLTFIALVKKWASGSITWRS